MAEFIVSNPGLRSRFDQTWQFRDYTDAELLEVLTNYVDRSEYLLGEGCDERILAVLAHTPRDKHFGNARTARQLFQGALRRHALRLVKEATVIEADLKTLIPEDFGPVPGSPSEGKLPFGFAATRWPGTQS